MLSFAHPSMLYIGAALAVPVLLHLMKRQTAAELVFPSIRFIRIGKLPREGRRRLRDIALLLLRLAAFALVVLALARPEWVPKGRPSAASAAGGKSQHVILLDSSASMGGWKSFENAKGKIREIAGKCENAEFALLLSDSAGRIILPMGASREEIIAALQSLEPTLLPGSHYAAVENSARLFSGKAERNIHIVSDFQLSDWQASGACVLPPGIAIDLVDSCPERTENAGIMGASSRRLADGRTEVVVEVRNFGIQEQSRTLYLRAPKKELAREVRIPAGKTVTFGFSLGEPDAGTTGAVFLSPDEYAADDSYSLWLGGDPPARVMAFMPKRDEPEKGDEMFFVQKALSVSKGAGMEFDFLSYGLEELANADIGSADAIFLLGAAAYLDDAQAASLAGYVDKGGTLVVTPGRAASSSASFLKQRRLVSADYQGLSQSKGISGVFNVAGVAENSILWPVFSGIEDSDLFAFPIYKYVRLSLSRPADAMMWTNEKLPFLIHQRKGGGQTFLFSAGLTADWSDFAFSTSFLPVIREIAASSVAGKGAGVLRISCGEKPPEGFGGVQPEGMGVAAPPAAVEKPCVLVSQKGVPLEVNVSRLESVTDKQSLSMLKRKMSVENPAAQAGLDASEEGGRQKLWHIFAFAAFVAFALENLLGAFLDKREAVSGNV